MMEGLSRICTTLAELNERMEQERKVYLAELEDRQRKGLRGDEAANPQSPIPNQSRAARLLQEPY